MRPGHFPVPLPAISYMRVQKGRWLILRDKNTLQRKVIGTIHQDKDTGVRSVMLDDFFWNADGSDTLVRDRGFAVRYFGKSHGLWRICNHLALRLSGLLREELPRIAKRNGRWFCTGLRCEGSAATPLEAYAIWKRYDDAMEVRVAAKAEREKP